MSRRDTHKAPPVVINSSVAGSGTCVTEKFSSVNVGSTSGSPLKSVKRATFRSEVFSLRSVEYTSRGKSSPLLK